MSKSGQIDALKYLSQAHREQFRERRTIEWKCVFITISFFVLSAAGVLKGDISLKDPHKIVIILAFLTIAFIASVFLAYVHIGGNKDKELAERAEDNLRGIVENENFAPKDLFGFEKYWTSWKTFRPGKVGRWAYIWQAITVCLFALVSGLLIWLKK